MNLSDEIRKQIEKNKGLKLAVGEINNHLSILENLVRKDIMEQVDEAYRRGLEDGKRTAVGAAELREKLEYQKGFEDGKAQVERGCEGCEYEHRGAMCTPCEYCSKNFKNLWRAKDDKIEVGDEVNAEDGTSVFTVTWMSENCICGVDEGGKCYSYEPQEICGKTGRHFDIEKILEAMKA